MKVLSIYVHRVADATRGFWHDVIPALKGWAKFTPTLRVAIGVIVVNYERTGAITTGGL